MDRTGTLTLASAPWTLDALPALRLERLHLAVEARIGDKPVSEVRCGDFVVFRMTVAAVGKSATATAATTATTAETTTNAEGTGPPSSARRVVIGVQLVAGGAHVLPAVARQTVLWDGAADTSALTTQTVCERTWVAIWAAS